eukprot:1591516-Pyramimonas_sp.AAC.2
MRDSGLTYARSVKWMAGKAFRCDRGAVNEVLSQGDEPRNLTHAGRTALRVTNEPTRRMLGCRIFGYDI